MSDRKRVLVDAPSEMTVLAARHLDATEGPVQVGRTVDTATRSAITTVLRYITTAHNSPAVETQTASEERPIGEIQVSRRLGRGLIVDIAPPRARMTLALLAEHGYGLSMVGTDQINIADQVLYQVVGYEPASAALLLELMEDWRPTPTAVLSEVEVEEIKARWQEAHGRPGTAHVVTEIRAEEPRDSDTLDRVRALEARLWEATDGRTMPVSAVCHSIANDLRVALNPPPEEDNPPVQCWHTEPDTPCDWNICRQPERLAAGDRGTDPARKEPS